MTKQVLDFDTKFKIGTYLQKVCVNRDGLSVYLNNETDHTVAKRFGATDVNIASIRKALIGPMDRKNVSQITDLEKRLTDIEEYLTWKSPNWRANSENT